MHPSQNKNVKDKNAESLQLQFIGMTDVNGPYVFINKTTMKLVKSYHAVFIETQCTHLPPPIDGGETTVTPDFPANRSFKSIGFEGEKFEEIEDANENTPAQENLTPVQENLNNKSSENLNNKSSETDVRSQVLDCGCEIPGGCSRCNNSGGVKTPEPRRSRRNMNLDPEIIPVFFADTGGSNAKQELNDDRVIVIDDEEEEMIKVNAKRRKGSFIMGTIMLLAACTAGAFYSEPLVDLNKDVEVEGLKSFRQFASGTAGVYDHAYPIHSHKTLIRDKYDVSKIKIPKTKKEALNSEYAEEWKIAMEIENQTLIDHQTFEIVDKPERCHLIGYKYVFALKKDQDGFITRFKARLVAKGYSQLEGKEYGQTYSPVVAMTTVLILITMAVRNGWDLLLLDFKGAFLHSKMPDEFKVYIKTPYGMKVPPDKVVKLSKSLYGTKNASHLWWEDLRQTLIEHGFVQSQNDPCLFTLKKGKYICTLCTFVDDLVISSNDTQRTKKFIDLLKKKGFVISSLEQLSWYLGIEIIIDRTKKTVKVLQTLYIEELIKFMGLEGANGVDTPLPSVLPTASDCPPDTAEGRKLRNSIQHEYRSILGKLSHLARHSRYDIKFAVFYLSRYQHNPGMAHLKAAKHIVLYLIKTKNEGLTLNTNDIPLCVYCDADHASNKDHRRSTSGYCCFVFGGCVYSKSTQQKCVTLSSTEAEVVALSRCVRDVLWIRNLLYDFGIKVPKTLIYEDNLGAIHLSKDSALSQRTKHIAIAYFFIRDHIVKSRIDVIHISTDRNVSDIFTKNMNKSQQAYHSKVFWKGLGNVPLEPQD